jgi:hypothetical integral membrane protein (TIGR02206 family)
LPAFAPFTTAHLVVLATFVILLVAWVVVARRLRSTSEFRRLEIGMGLLGLACWIVVAAWWLLPAHYRLDKSLPLALCDWASLTAPLGLIWPRRLLSTLNYFWGVGLCTQAFITPTVQVGPGEFFFWSFWLQHSIIVGCAVYEFAVRGYRPTWQDFWIAIAASYVYLGVAMLANYLLEANYGFVGDSRPETPTVVDRLGPWPKRVLWIILLVHAAFTLAMIPWMLEQTMAWRRRRREFRALY